MSAEIQTYLGCLLISLVVSGVIVIVAYRRNRNVLNRVSGPQNIHQGAVPRIGGLAIFLGFLAGVLLFEKNAQALIPLMLIMALPVFLAGFVEDLTGVVSPNVRLLCSMITGGLFCWLTGYKITNVDYDLVNMVLAVPAVSVLLTSIAIATLANAVNIVDGLNGLAAATTMLMIASFGLLAVQFGDTEIAMICFALIASGSGFVVWNFPFGKIFLGDGGAYFLGALAAALSVMLPERNAEISPFSSLLIIIYPFYELLRSYIRRVSISGARAFEPDDRHLHSLIFKFVMHNTQFTKPMQNSLASLIAMILPLLCCLWAIMFFGDKFVLVAGVIGFVAIYEALTFWVYTSLSKCHFI